MKKLVVLTGAGISAESGINTFRDMAEGYWHKYKVEDVCTHRALVEHPQDVLDFLNYFYDDAKDRQPNAAHKVLRELESKFDVTVVTQNIDDLHEKAGSSKIIHLHGELATVCSTRNPKLIVRRTDLDNPHITVDSVGPDGNGLRPNIVLFDEPVPMFEEAIDVVSEADIFVVIGTSMVVYPAASLIQYIPSSTHTYFIDPNPNSSMLGNPRIKVIPKKASEGVVDLVKLLENEQ
ncbi:MAG: NAD-dependent deacylase [Paludibacteraceae bacterium]|nr:NAD-dependent deacylase [Paludibacteraceae bacterium]